MHIFFLSSILGKYTCIIFTICNHSICSIFFFKTERTDEFACAIKGKLEAIGDARALDVVYHRTCHTDVIRKKDTPGLVLTIEIFLMRNCRFYKVKVIYISFEDSGI